MTNGAGQEGDFSREVDAIFGDVFAADPSLGKKWDTLTDQSFADDGKMVALLRRSSFLTSFMELYGKVDDTPGYSHRATLKVAEGFSDDMIPTEEAAVAKTPSSINSFIDAVLTTAAELEVVREKHGEAVYEEDSNAIKFAFATDAWFHYEEACPWLLRIIDTAIVAGVETATISQADIGTEAFLVVGRTPEEQAQYSAMESQLFVSFAAIRGEEFWEKFKDISNQKELLAIAVHWGTNQAVIRHEQSDKHSLTEQARGYLERLYKRDILELEQRLEVLAKAEGVNMSELAHKIQPYATEIYSVAEIGIIACNTDDEETLPLEMREILDEWFPEQDSYDE